ncbi:Predicted arabinose efflux permease, MFS family [Thermomonospora echinospora]|uniref:Predicted arabinose efflux permease, MFS family n=1 Tax=Thermomonospora echinospora TaxID=1992 RepID=A0A1H6AH48_9ACTN|nr:MFS transporter [Thermomonospora echinospora]SEG47570.1 Predicted arabinose efflux permease, MFS family [Thermomonospora echinospora]
MRAYVAFLRLPYAGRLLGGTLLGRLPNGMGALAIVLHVRDQGGGYPLAGALAAVYGLATAAGQPVLGRVMDRLGQPRVLTASAWAAAAGFVLLAVLGTDPLPLTVAAVVLAGFATPPLEAGLRALWPVVLPGPAHVRAAYALDAASQEILFTVGPLVVVAAATLSTETALWLTGALGIAGTVVVTSSRPSREWRGEPRAADWAGPLRSPGMRTLVAALACAGIALGVYSVAVVAYAERLGSEAASGLLLAVMSGGALTGGLVYGARPWPGEDHRRLPYLLGGLALGYLPLALAPALPIMLVLAFLSGVFLAPVLACSFTLVDRLAPRGTVTEAFAWIVAAIGAGAALGSAVAGLGQDLAGVPGAFAGAGAGGILALAVCLLARHTIRPTKADVTILPMPGPQVGADETR